MSSICFRIASGMTTRLPLIKQSSTTDREDEYFLNSCTSGLLMCCGHPSRTYRFTSEMTGSLFVESFSWFLLYVCNCELIVLMVQTVSTSLSPSSQSKDKSGPAGSLLSLLYIFFLAYSIYLIIYNKYNQFYN